MPPTCLLLQEERFGAKTGNEKNKYAGIRATPAKLPLHPKLSFLLASPLLISEVILLQIQSFALLFKQRSVATGQCFCYRRGRELARGMQRSRDAPGAHPMQVAKSHQ